MTQTSSYACESLYKNLKSENTAKKAKEQQPTENLNSTKHQNIS